MKFLILQLSVLVCVSINFFSCKENSFLIEHWKHPLPLLNDSNKGIQLQLSSFESNFDPKQCATCHETQWRGWKNSFHSKSIGSGLVWQKEILDGNEFNTCLDCHSPLPETKVEVSESFRTKEILISQKNHFPEGITNPSIQCASCHIRNQIWYGPPSKNQSVNKTETFNSNLPHNGFQSKPEFESSGFCKSCHESPENGILLNGKRLMEVYKEWEESSYAKQGVQCQNCHMPNREHSWKGIHDKEFVRSAVEPKWELSRIKKDTIHIHAELKNIHVGHKFPTYLIPKITLRFYAIDTSGKRNLIEESIIGRLVDTKFTHEYYDTRISPNENHTVEYEYHLNEENIKSIVWETQVHPDEHYIRSFEESLKERGEFLSAKAREQLKLSLSEKRESSYILFTLSLPMPASLRQ